MLISREKNDRVFWFMNLKNKVPCHPTPFPVLPSGGGRQVSRTRSYTGPEATNEHLRIPCASGFRAGKQARASFGGSEVPG